MSANGAGVDTKRLVAANSPENAGQWMSYGRDYSEQRFSPLKQIDASNAGQLGLAWFGDLYERGGSYEATPVVVDGRVFVTSPGARSTRSTRRPASSSGSTTRKVPAPGP